MEFVVTRRKKDHVIEACARKALLSDTRLSSQVIHVAVCDTVAYLTGRVQSYRRKLLAQRVVAECDERLTIVNQIEVEPATLVDDEALAARAWRALEGCAGIDGHTITVAVKGGSVILRGSVGKDRQRVLAGDVVLAVRGVRAVKNLILVDPEALAQDRELCSRVQAALDRTQLLQRARIHASVDHGVIVISGRVPNPIQKELAREVATRYTCHLVRDEIVVEA
jgi:osmotically-inducible protein OsmY